MTNKTTAANATRASAATVSAPAASGMNRSLTLLFAIAAGAAVGNLY